MLRKKLYGIISIGMLMTVVTTSLSILSVVNSPSLSKIFIVLAINLGVYVSLLIGLLEYFVFHRINSIAKDIDDVENNRKPKCCLIDHGSNDEISYITRKLSQVIDGLYYIKKQKADLVIPYRPAESPKSKAL